VQRCLNVIIVTLFVLFFVEPIYAQKPVQLISTLSIGAASKSVTSKGERISFPQSIGQSGVIGVFRKNDLLLRQGFIQPVMSRPNSPKVKIIFAELFPNPFINDLTISFREEIRNTLFVNLIDLQGRVIYSRKFTPSNKIVLYPGTIPSGLYLLQISVDKQQYIWKVIKK
jgi:hypothetical protein